MAGNLIHILATLLQIYSFVLLARIVLSWIPNVSPAHPAVQLLYQLTEPVLEPVRRLIPSLGMIDISPLIVFVLLHLLQRFLLNLAAGL